MGFNKIPLALRFNDTTGNIEGLQEFNIDEAVDLSGLSFSSLSGIDIDGITNGQVIVYVASSNSFEASTIPTGGGGGACDLGVAANASQIEITNTCGANAIIPAVGSDAGLMIPDDKSKLNDIEPDADITDATNVAAAGALMRTGGTPGGIITGDVTFTTIEENAIMVTNDASAVSSVSGVSGSLVYFSGTDPKPVLTGIPTIMQEAGVRVEDKDLGDLDDTYSTSPVDGSVLYRQGGVWTAQRIDLVQQGAGGGGGDDGGVSVKFDHGGLSGLGDDDHTQYVLSDGTRAMTSLTVNNNIATSGIFAKNIVADPEDGLNIRAVNISGTTSVSSPNITGTDITARNNLYLSGDLNATYTKLANAGITTTLHREVGAPVASSNSTSLAEVASYTLPANVLTLGDIDIMIRGRQLAQGSNLRWNFKIAGTNILNSSISQGTYSDFTRYTMHIQISKMATDRQMVTAHFVQGTGTGSAAGFSGWSSTHRVGLIHNEATGDESGTLALSLEAQQSNSSQTVAVDHFTVKLVPNAFA